MIYLRSFRLITSLYVCPIFKQISIVRCESLSLKENKVTKEDSILFIKKFLMSENNRLNLFSSDPSD